MEFTVGGTTTNRFNTNFCLVMANHLLLKEAVAKRSNFVISPLSFHVLLSLIAVGSKGRTLEQLLFFLGSKDAQDLILLSSQMISLALPANDESKNHSGGPTLSFINGAWVAEGLKLKSSFQEIVRRVYNATAKEVDFMNKTDEVIDEINTWAENATSGLVKDLLPEGCLERETALVLANALYFKGAWAQKFDVSRTEHRDFHLLSGHTVRVPFITSQKPYHLYGSFDGYKILKLPYRSGQDARQFSMYLFLPEAVDGLQNLVNRFKSNPEFFNKQFTSRYEELPDMWIPKFKFSFEFEAKKTMVELGLDLPFQCGCEITEMVDSPQALAVSKMYHKSYIEVNEEGTEAAASTAAIKLFRCAIYPRPSFVADHPFMFMIREETSKIVFFIGAVLNPLLES